MRLTPPQLLRRGHRVSDSDADQPQLLERIIYGMINLPTRRTNENWYMIRWLAHHQNLETSRHIRKWLRIRKINRDLRDEEVTKDTSPCDNLDNTKMKPKSYPTIHLIRGRFGKRNKYVKKVYCVRKDCRRPHPRRRPRANTTW